MRCGLSRVVAPGTSLDGAKVELAILSLGEMVDSAYALREMFAPEQLDQAMTRFHEIESARAT